MAVESWEVDIAADCLVLPARMFWQEQAGLLGACWSVQGLEDLRFKCLEVQKFRSLKVERVEEFCCLVLDAWCCSSRKLQRHSEGGTTEESPLHQPAPKEKEIQSFIAGDSRPYRTVRSGGSRSFLPRNDGVVWMNDVVLDFLFLVFEIFLWFGAWYLGFTPGTPNFRHSKLQVL